MYDVMIVEDEILVRIGLKNMIDWAGMNMQVIAETENGEDALEIYRKMKPALILTDIKMPVMDGIEMISRIREKDKKTKIIVLTCYDEFDLVRKAFTLGISDYIIKLRMSAREMESVVRKVYNELVSEDINQDMAQKSVPDAARLKSEWIMEYLLHPSYSGREFCDFAGKMRLRLTEFKLVLCIMKVDMSEQTNDEFSKSQSNTVCQAILNLTGELLEDYQRGEIIKENNGRFLLMLSFGDMSSEQNMKSLLHEMLDKISVTIRTYTNRTVTFGISRFADGYPSIHRLYGEALDALGESYFLGDQKHIYYSNDENRQCYLSSIDSFHEFILENSCLDEEYRKDILHGIDLLKSMYNKPKNEIQEMFIRWVHLPSINTNIAGNGSVSRLSIEYAARIRSCAAINETMEVFKQYLQTHIRLQSGLQAISREVSEAVGFIKAHYSEDISLQIVAEMVGMNADYFSSLFKKEIHVSFVSYVNRIRIEKAKEMLLNTHLKSYEIAERVGFTDESYFSRVFKNITGHRPSEFKKRNVIQENGFLEAGHD